jgi:hypothetical protein
MSRQIALAARHPFRRDFVQTTREARQRREDHDLKLFVLSFTAFFICIYTFIF